MSEETSGSIEITARKAIDPNYSGLTFYNKEEQPVGNLYMDRGKLVFNGDIDISATVFIDFINGKMTQTT